MAKNKPMRMTKKNIQRTIVEGMKKAQKFYSDLNEGFSISWGPEYLLTTFVGQELHKNGVFFELESNIKDRLEEKGLKERSCTKKMRHTGRNDIVIYNKQGYSIAAAEIKNGVGNYARIKKDVLRIRDLIRKNAIEYGYISFIMDLDLIKKEGVDYTAKMNEKINDIMEQVDYDCSNSRKESYNLSVSKEEVLLAPVLYKLEQKERIWIWAGVCFCIS
jgi:hypothetical protein